MTIEQMLSMNLQFFAADTGNEGDSAPEQPEGQENNNENQKGTDSQDKSEETKTFTQEDVNNIATKEARKQQEKILKELGIDDFKNAKEGMKKFKEWQDSQKTEQEKQKEQLESLSTEKESLTNENQTLKAQMSALRAGVKGDSVEDVVTLAKNMVDDDTDMDEAIKKVIEKYPHFAGAEEEEEEKPNFTTGQHQKGNSDKDPFAAVRAKYKK